MKIEPLIVAAAVVTIGYFQFPKFLVKCSMAWELGRRHGNRVELEL